MLVAAFCMSVHPVSLAMHRLRAYDNDERHCVPVWCLTICVDCRSSTASLHQAPLAVLDVASANGSDW